MYFSGQGKVYAAVPDVTGNPGAFRYLGNVSVLKISPKTTTTEHKESVSGQRLTDLTLVTEKNVGMDITLDEWLAENLALGLYGVSSVLAGGTVTAEAFPLVLAAGDFVRLAQTDVSAVVITDSNATPVTAVLGTDYEITNAKTGMIKILSDPTTFTAPLLAAYTSAGGTNINMFTGAPPIRWLRFDGLNTADSDAPVLIEIYRVHMDPMGEMDPISDALSSIVIAGQALYDATKVSDATLGQFGRIVQIAA